jgi:ABC-2 type transport system ATP-binding protein
VDPVGRKEIRNILVRLKGEGRTVFLNSHLLSELEMVCDRVAILVQGRVSSQGTIDELTRGQQRYEIEVGAADEPAPDLIGLLPRTVFRALPAPADAGAPAPAEASAATPFAEPGAAMARRVGGRGELASGEAVEIDRHTVRVATTDPAKVQPLIDAVRARGLMIRSVRPFRPSLEDLFMQAVTDPATGQTLPPGAARGAGHTGGRDGGGA